MDEYFEEGYFKADYSEIYNGFEFELGIIPKPIGLWYALIKVPSVEFLDYIFRINDLFSSRPVDQSDNDVQEWAAPETWLGHVIYNACKTTSIHPFLMDDNTVKLGIPIGLEDKMKADENHQDSYDYSKDDAIRVIHDVIDGILAQELLSDIMNNHD